MLKYEGQIWRPPSEAKSLIFQITIGCSHNPPCAFCVSYRKKAFRIKTLKEVENDLDVALQLGYRNAKRIFLADGDALVVKTETLLSILKLLQVNFPNLERIGIYGSVQNIIHKSLEDLIALKRAGLNIIYVGFETGDDFLLEKIKKGVTREQNIQAGLRVKEAGISLSAILILGLGGPKGSQRHINETATMFNRIKPNYLAALTLMLPDGTEMKTAFERNEFTPLKPEELLEELRDLILNLTELNNTIFRTNHASNYLPLKGILSQDRERLLNIIEYALEAPKEYLKPEYFRGL